MSAGGTLRTEFEADAWNSTISFATGIPVALNGTLELTFAAGTNLASQIGRTFNLFDWAGVSPTGTFAVSSSYTWNLTNLYTTGEVTLQAIPLSGDFNHDGTVDAADYVVWRKGLGTTTTQNDYDAWRGDFGTSLGDGAHASGTTGVSNVPEPGTLFLLLFGAAVATHWRRHITLSLNNSSIA
jgi:hypothetical protein